MKEKNKGLGGVLFEAALIAFVAALVAFAFQWQGKGNVSVDDSGVYVSIDEIDQFPNILWVDARTWNEYYTKRVAGSVLLNQEDWEELLFPLLERWTPDQTILVYCSRSACLRSLNVAKRLRSELGVDSVFAIEGGWVRIVESGVVLE